MPGVEVSEATMNLLVNNIPAESSVVRTIEGRTSMLATVINVKIAKTVANFLTTSDKSLNSDLFCYNCNT